MPTSPDTELDMVMAGVGVEAEAEVEEAPEAPEPPGLLQVSSRPLQDLQTPVRLGSSMMVTPVLERLPVHQSPSPRPHPDHMVSLNPLDPLDPLFPVERSVKVLDHLVTLINPFPVLSVVADQVHLPVPSVIRRRRPEDRHRTFPVLISEEERRLMAEAAAADTADPTDLNRSALLFGRLPTRTSV